MLLEREKHPVTGENLEKIDSYIKEHDVSVYVKIYPDCSSRADGVPTIHEAVNKTVWDNVIHYCGKFYDGGCMEVCMLEADEEVVLFHIEEGSHYLPFDVDYILGGT